jgi:hypothetical protein
MKKQFLLNTTKIFGHQKQTQQFYRSPFVKFLSWVLIIAVLNLSQGCKNYFKVTKDTKPVSESLPVLQSQNKTFILHLENKSWVFQNPDILENALTGIAIKPYESVLSYPVDPIKPNRYKKKYPENFILNEVHIYCTELTRVDSAKVTVPFSGIQKIEIYEKDKNATGGSYFLGALGITAGVAAVLTIIVALTKSSCPFIYTIDGEQSELTGEIYSGSVQPALERNDYLKIPCDRKNAELKLKIANEVREIQHTNLMELWVFDHSKNVQVLVDKYGNYHTVTNLVSPVKAETFTGADVKDLIQAKDSLFYSNTEIKGELPLTDGFILEFPNPGDSKLAKLFIRAKNSFVLDYMIGQFNNQFGDLYKKWQKKQQNAPAEQLKQWSLDQNIPLSLSVERNGIWEKADYFNIAGPIAMREDVLAIPLNGTESNPLKIKLEWGNFFWEIDYAGVDYSPPSEISFKVIPVKTAITQNREEVGKMLQKDDLKYYIQPEVGDIATVSFVMPELTGEERTVILHSKGWYQILRNPTGTPDREYLESFRQPGRFNQFVNEYIQTLTNK